MKIYNYCYFEGVSTEKSVNLERDFSSLVVEMTALKVSLLKP